MVSQQDFCSKRPGGSLTLAPELRLSPSPWSQQQMQARHKRNWNPKGRNPRQTYTSHSYLYGCHWRSQCGRVPARLRCIYRMLPCGKAARHLQQLGVLLTAGLTSVSGLRFLMMGFSLTDRCSWYPLRIKRWLIESPTRWMLAPITNIIMQT